MKTDGPSCTTDSGRQKKTEETALSMNASIDLARNMKEGRQLPGKQSQHQSRYLRNVSQTDFKFILIYISKSPT